MSMFKDGLYLFCLSLILKAILKAEYFFYNYTILIIE